MSGYEKTNEDNDSFDGYEKAKKESGEFDGDPSQTDCSSASHCTLYKH